MQQTKTYVGLLCLLAAQGVSRWASAAQTGAPSMDITIRLNLPLTGLTLFGQNGGYFTMAGGYISLHFLRDVEAELGGAAILNPCANGSLLTARAGLAPTLVHRHSDGTGFRLRLPLLASFQTLHAKGDTCDGHTEDSVKMFNGSSGLDAAYFWKPTGGLSLRVLGLYGTVASGDSGREYGATLDFGGTFDIL